jgi:SAM-dependent methyltransferase
LESQVFPIHAEAHALPFADGFFDAIVSMDSYHYYGTEDRYLGGYFARLVKPGGQIGIVVPGVVTEFESAEPPKHLQSSWYFDFWTFHSPNWWRRHWERSGNVTIEVADMIPDGWKLWRDSDQISAEWNDEERGEADLLHVDAGRNLGFTRIVARRSAEERWRG